MGSRRQLAKYRRMARERELRAVPADLGHLYGKRGGVTMDDGQSYTFDMGEILWSLGTGAITGEVAEAAAAAWLANVMQDQEDPMSLVRNASKLGVDPARAYAVAETPLEAADVPRLAKELIDAGLLPPPPTHS